MDDTDEYRFSASGGFEINSPIIYSPSLIILKSRFEFFQNFFKFYLFFLGFVLILFSELSYKFILNSFIFEIVILILPIILIIIFYLFIYIKAKFNLNYL